MAGRGGRGGGRGRGRGMTFDARDMGFGAGEQLPGPVLQPPPTYPPLEHQPLVMTTTPEMEYMVALKKDFEVFLKDRWSFNEREEVKNISRHFDWRLFPSELKPKKKMIGQKRPATEKLKKNFDLNVLDALAKMEEKPDEPETEKEADGEEKGDGEEAENEDEEELDDLDEEMDDGTDYVNNYFDNGEGFDDDDDNGNDGPIY